MSAVVIDSSALVEVLIRNGAIPVTEHGALAGLELLAPHLIDPEVVSTTRHLTFRSVLSADDASALLHDFRRTPIERFPQESLIENAWSVRDNISPYDAMYVGLARTVGIPLLTADRRLARAAASQCTVRLLE